MGKAELVKVDMAALAQAGKEADELGSQLDAMTRELTAFLGTNSAGFARATRMSLAIQWLRDALPVEFVTKRILPLQNSPLGFLTDKPQGGYPAEVVRDVLIEATLRGFLPVANEFNIIAGRFYAAKNGWWRRLMEWPGLTNLEVETEIVAKFPDGALVPVRASWLLNGVADGADWTLGKDAETGEVVDRRIPVRVNQGMIIDAILGKALAKAYRRIVLKLSGDSLLIPPEEEPALETEAAPSRPAPKIGTLAPADLQPAPPEAGHRGHDAAGLGNVQTVGVPTPPAQLFESKAPPRSGAFQ